MRDWGEGIVINDETTDKQQGIDMDRTVDREDYQRAETVLDELSVLRHQVSVQRTQLIQALLVRLLVLVISGLFAFPAFSDLIKHNIDGVLADPVSLVAIVIAGLSGSQCLILSMAIWHVNSVLKEYYHSYDVLASKLNESRRVNPDLF